MTPTKPTPSRQTDQVTNHSTSDTANIVVCTPVGNVLVGENIQNSHHVSMIVATLRGVVSQFNTEFGTNYGPVVAGSDQSGRTITEISPNKLDSSFVDKLREVEAEFKLS